MTTLHTLRPSVGAVKPRKRVGRGPGSGHGKTAARGHKGLKSRSGGKPASGFEGGQMPLQRRLPKRGFTNIFKIIYQIVNITDLQGIEAHAIVTREFLQRMGKIKSSAKPIKILGDGEITVPLTIRADKFSQVAKQKIIAAGGTAEEQSA